MPPIALAMALAQYAPQVIRWITGSDKAEDAAEKVVAMAEVVTGEHGQQAVEKLNGSPELQVQFREAVMANELEMDRAYLADRAGARTRDIELRRAGQRNSRADIMVALAFIAVIVIASLMAFGAVNGDSAAGGFLVAVGGMFARNIGTAFDFEFGSSRGDKDKDNILAAAQRRTMTP
jgi:hypothetical protein